MKKTIAIILILTLSLTCVSLAGAEAGKEFTSSVVRNMKESSATYTANQNNRALISALVLAEYWGRSSANRSAVNRVLSSGSCYVVKYGSCVDLFFPTGSGKYLNLFLMPTSGTIKDYGVKAFSAGGYTYYKVSMSSVWSRFRKYREMIYGY